jgi:opacity protein-like surface antigen
MKNKVLKFIVFFSLIAFSFNSYAGDAHFNSYFGARTLALNGMYIAGVDGLTANMNNPSSIAYLEGIAVDLAFYAKIGEYSYTHPDKGNYTSYREENPRFNIGTYWHLFETATLSIGYIPAIDYRIDWPYAMLLGDELNQVILTFDMYNKINAEAISLGFGYAFPDFALGLALNVYDVSHQMAFPIATPNWSSMSILRGAYQFNYEQNAWTFGLNLGISWTLSETLKIGALVRSGYQADLSGTATSNMFRDIALADTNFTGKVPPSTVEMTSTIEFPWIAGVGMVYKMSEKLQLNFDLLYNEWGGARNEMRFNFSDQTWNQALAEQDSVTGIQGNTLKLPAENSLEIGVGMEYFTSPDLVIRAGYKYSQTPNTAETFSMTFPTVSQHWLSAGIGIEEGNYQINLTAAYAFGVIKNVASTENEFWYGTYDGQTFIPALSIHYTF